MGGKGLGKDCRGRVGVSARRWCGCGARLERWEEICERRGVQRLGRWVRLGGGGLGR